ncbi:hypothetical protein ACSX1A_01025 [Pontibacter sp. MBLB2868]|uniref:hypothetical protein n=1 Tax=Pontibacter sp. MBLB2868 TaxID=3451555 RepID=UPI003F74DC78
MMTVFYLISNRQQHNSGRGGSYFSSASVAKVMSENLKVYYFNIGDHDSPVAKEILGNKYINLKMGGLNNFYSIFKYIYMTFKYRPDVVHIYDLVVVFFAYFSQLFSSSKIVLTQPGGANRAVPSKYTPKNVITCSVENFNFYKELKECKHVVNISNRVIPFSTNEKSVGKLKELINYKPTDLIVMKVGRLDNYYGLGIQQAYDFYKELKENHVSVKLIYLGHHENGFMPNPEALCDPDVFFVQDQHFTKDAKTVIDIANYIVANGRSAMEACFLGKRLLVPSKKHGLISINRENYIEAINYNFSERIVVNDSESISCTESSFFYKSLFEDYFNIKNASKKYEQFYVKSVKDSPKLIYLLKSFTSLFFNFR